MSNYTITFILEVKPDQYFVQIIYFIMMNLFVPEDNDKQQKPPSKNNILQTPRKSQITNSHLGRTPIPDNVFLKSLNMSAIGQMSGQNQTIQTLNQELIQALADRIFHIDNKRFDFSHYVKRKQEDQPKLQLSQEDMKILKLKSFIHLDGKDLVQTSGCGKNCESALSKQTCKCELLNQSTLQIYAINQQSQQFTQLISSINFDTVSVKIDYQSIKQNKQIKIVAGKYQLVLEHERKEVIDYWNQKLQIMLKQSRGFQYNLTALDNVEEFYKNRYQTQQSFVKHCQTGDILLFQDSHFFAKVQRFVTRSDYDHVGIVIKDPANGILIFQANSGSGVGLTLWRFVIKYKWYKTIPKITWRRLQGVERNNQFNQKLQNFVTSNLQKCYHISLNKLMMNHSVIRVAPSASDTPQQRARKQQQNGFFCSQLVATVYKELGLLTRDRQNPNYLPAVKFYPKDFSVRADRKLDKGYLSPEYELVFDSALISSKQTKS